jgi:low affinity Fe/Cu permease
MTDKKKALAAVRDEIDAIDKKIQELLIRRTEVVEQVRAIKEGETVKIRPSANWSASGARSSSPRSASKARFPSPSWISRTSQATGTWRATNTAASPR